MVGYLNGLYGRERSRRLVALHRSQIPRQRRPMSDFREPGGRWIPSKQTVSGARLVTAVFFLLLACGSGAKEAVRPSVTVRARVVDGAATDAAEAIVAATDDAGIAIEQSESGSYAPRIANNEMGPSHASHPTDGGQSIDFDAGLCGCDEHEFACLGACYSAQIRDGGNGPFFRDHVAQSQMARSAALARSCGTHLVAAVRVEFSNNGKADRVTILQLTGSRSGSRVAACIDSAFRQAWVPPYVGKRMTVDWTIHVL